MGIFNNNHHKKVIELLQRMKVDFKFDQKGIKTRLLSNIEEQLMSSTADKIKNYNNKPFYARHKWAVGFSTIILLVIFGSGVTLAQADVAKPGDKLYGLDQWHEKMLLKIPLPASQKAKMYANIIDERNQELDYLLKVKNHNRVKAEAVKTSQQSLNQAIEQVRSAGERLDERGKSRQADRVQEVLIRLEGLAAEQEQRVESLKEIEDNQEIKSLLDEDLIEIKRARLRANITEDNE
jgi:hypothetical protein